jgi:hypothetical protein
MKIRAIENLTLGHLFTRFRRTSDGEVNRGPKQGFDFVASAVVIFSADLKSYLSHPLNMHFFYNRVVESGA